MEACGIACYDGQRFHTERHMGHVGDAFGGADLTERLPGRFAIGHLPATPPPAAR